MQPCLPTCHLLSRAPAGNLVAQKKPKRCNPVLSSCMSSLWLGRERKAIKFFPGRSGCGLRARVDEDGTGIGPKGRVMIWNNDLQVRGAAFPRAFPPPSASKTAPFRAALQKKVGETAAPMAENLERYLAANPHCEVFVESVDEVALPAQPKRWRGGGLDKVNHLCSANEVVPPACLFQLVSPLLSLLSSPLCSLCCLSSLSSLLSSPLSSLLSPLSSLCSLDSEFIESACLAGGAYSFTQEEEPRPRPRAT